jgi:cytochrome bd ubiquinol oxidase subunit II
MEILEVIWYLVIMASIVFYTVLDGFDLGAGALHLCTSNDKERRIFLSAIGPVWDGNEVWLVAVLGSMLAGFPTAYATILSSFYIPVMFLLFGLIFRAVSIEFRSKLESVRWRTVWDWSFSISSIVVILSLGLIMGNFVQGIPVNKEGVFIQGLISHIHPYSLLVSVTTLALFCLHGACFLELKVEGELSKKVLNWARISFLFFMVCYLATTVATIVWAPHMVDKMMMRPIFWMIALVNLGVIITLGRALIKNKVVTAFVCSSLNILFLVSIYAFGSFPVLLRASNDISKNITIYNASSSLTTLIILVIIAVIAIPLIAGYTTHVYKVFHGKVKDDFLIY